MTRVYTYMITPVHNRWIWICAHPRIFVLHTALLSCCLLLECKPQLHSRVWLQQQGVWCCLALWGGQQRQLQP